VKEVLLSQLQASGTLPARFLHMIECMPVGQTRTAKSADTLRCSGFLKMRPLDPRKAGFRYVEDYKVQHQYFNAGREGGCDEGAFYRSASGMESDLMRSRASE
jgi:hypothetical protein